MQANRTTVRSLTLLTALLGLSPAAPAAAADDDSAQVTEVAVAEVEEPEADASRWSGTLQSDFTNAYFFRGIKNERNSFIWQPWAELFLNLYSSDDGLLRDASVGMGVWNSVHEDKTAAEHSPEALYETDWYPMLSLGFAGGVTLDTYYYFYTSPNGAWDTVQELNFKLSWDDSDYLKAFPLQPWINFAVETDRTSMGNDKGVGIQMGIEPTIFELDNKSVPVTLSTPIELGLSATDYYEGDDGNSPTFGYLSYGLTATMPLKFIDPSWGKISWILSAKGLYLENTLAEVNNNDDNYGVVMSSLSFEF